jgi:hypothetical protein
LFDIYIVSHNRGERKIKEGYFLYLPSAAHNRKTRKNGDAIYISPSDCGTNGPDAAQAVIITIMPVRKTILEIIFVSLFQSVAGLRPRALLGLS